MDAAPGILAAVVAASLLGSLHCAGMCGGLVLFAVGSDGKMEKKTSLHLAYHGLRGFSYTVLGVAAGAVGAAADITASLQSGARLSAILAGSAMIVVGLMALLQNLGIMRLSTRLPGPLQRTAERTHRWAFGLPPLQRAAVIGALTPMLPCGWLYAFVIVAAGTGHPLMGALVMVAFWAGTLPVMGMLGIGLDKLTGPLRRRLPVLTSIVVVGLGVMTALGRVGLPTNMGGGIATGTVAERLTAVRSLSHEDMPWCNAESGTESDPAAVARSEAP